MSNKMQPIDMGERAKIAKLHSESKDAELDHKVEWLYSGDKIDRDAYLLGKPIDKLLIEKEILKPKDTSFLTSTVDLANKIREDPLFEIKKQEIEAKRRLLENPMRIKQLKQMISQSSDRRDRQEEHIDDGGNRSAERRQQTGPQRKRRDSSASASSSDDERSHSKKSKKTKKKSKKHKKKHDRERRHRSSSSGGEKAEEEKDKERREDSPRRHHHHHQHKSSASHRSRSRSRSRERQRAVKKEGGVAGYGLVKRGEEKTGGRKDSEHTDTQPKTKAQLEIEEYKTRIDKMKQMRSTTSSTSSASASTAAKPQSASRLTDEERQRRLDEMQQNAKWRSEVRVQSVHKHRESEKREELLESRNNIKSNQHEASHLFNNMMRDAYVSAEDRIKRNIKNIQRNESALDKNFARK